MRLDMETAVPRSSLLEDSSSSADESSKYVWWRPQLGRPRVHPVILAGENALLEMVGVVVFEVATMWALILHCAQRAGEDPMHDNLFLDEIRHWQLRLAGTTTSSLSLEDGGNSSMYRTIDEIRRTATPELSPPHHIRAK
jgi:hypothetical protein